MSFEVGDVICVIEYDDPEDQVRGVWVLYIISKIINFLFLLQEEGWLMGMKEGTDEKGMFPANFTRPL